MQVFISRWIQLLVPVLFASCESEMKPILQFMNMVCFHSPSHSRPPTHRTRYIFWSLLIFYTDFPCFYQTHVCLETALFGFSAFLGVLQLPLRTSKYFKPFQRQRYANEAELEKPLKSFPLEHWLYVMVLCQLPSMTVLQWVALCWVKAHCLQLLRIFVSLKSGVQLWTLLFTLWKPAEGDHFKHLQKTLLLHTHNNISKITNLAIACLLKICQGFFPRFSFLECFFFQRVC